MDNLRGEAFLDNIYQDLHMSDEVMHTFKNKDSKKEKIHRYMERLERINQKASKREIDIINLKYLYHKKYVIKEKDLPSDISNEEKKKIIKNQEDSLDEWIDFLVDKNTSLPTWAKYWAFQGMLKIGTYDEENDTYQKRSKKTTKRFIEADSEIITRCIDIISKFIDTNTIDDTELEKLIKSGSFPKLYTSLIKNKRKKVINKSGFDGIWITYHYETEKDVRRKKEEGITPEFVKLYNSLQGQNTHWCTAGSRSMAMEQVCGNRSAYLGGNFYVYYTKDDNGEYKVPRIAIRMNQNDIGEIKGVADESLNVEEGFEEIIENKLKTLKDINEDILAENMKKIDNMRKLTLLNQKNRRKEPFTKEDIAFLYEIYDRIETFGGSKDGRIKKIISTRNIQNDYDSLKDRQDQVAFIISAYYDKVPTLTLKDKKYIIRSIKHNPIALKYMDESLKNDRDIVLAAVKGSSYVLNYVDRKFKKDKEIILEAVKQGTYDVANLDENLRKDKEIMIEAIKLDVYNIIYADECLKKDKDLVLLAVKKDGMMLACADGSLKKDREVVLVAINNNPFSLKYADKRLKKDKNIVLKAVSLNGLVLEEVDYDLLKDEDVVLAAVKENGWAIEEADSSLTENPQFLLKAIRENSEVFVHIADRFKKDEGFILEALEQNPKVLKYIIEWTNKSIVNDQTFIQKLEEFTQIDNNKYKR
ncbi:MAG: DUF4116 domain-containing protein [Bacilli bacterium]|nr:DUF4116 domain-containing protein [Bacilli bacterium]